MTFRLSYDARLNRIRADIRGFWTVETVHGFAAAAGAKALEVRTIRDDYDMLIDSSDFPVQANDVADLLPRIADAALSLTSGRAAAVVGSHLNKLQAERTQTNPRLKVFLSMAEAESWLDAPAGDTSTEHKQRR